MTSFYQFELYLNWLKEKVADERHQDYDRLLNLLGSLDFFWLNPLDENRARDGVALRKLYCDVTESALMSNYKPCSILEMMVALAIRCDQDIMYDFEVGSQASKWFWEMVANLGLESYNDTYFDEDAAALILHRLLYREYGANGEGGLFFVENPRKDLREVDIWYQMQWHLTESHK